MKKQKTNNNPKTNENKKDKKKNLIIILSGVSVAVLSLSIGLGIGLSNKNRLNDSNGESPDPQYRVTGATVEKTVGGSIIKTRFDIYEDIETKEKFVQVPEYKMNYESGEIGLEGNPLINITYKESPHSAGKIVDYTSGKNGFFKIDYMNMGYVKLDYDNGVILGGWERDEASDDNVPTRITEATTSPDNYNWGLVEKDAIRFDLTKVLQAKKGANSEFTANLAPYIVPSGDTERYVCFSLDPVKITDTTKDGVDSAVGKYDLFEYLKGQTSLPTNSSDRCFSPSVLQFASNTKYTTTLPYIRHITTNTINGDDIGRFFAHFNNVRSTEFQSDTRFPWLSSRVSQIGYLTHPIFGKIKVNSQNRFVNPYTLKEEKLSVNDKGKIIFPETKVPLFNFNAEQFDSESYGANHIIKLYNKLYNLTKEEQLDTKGVELQNQIKSVEELNQTFCVSNDISDLDLTKKYYNDILKIERTITEPAYDHLTDLYEIKTKFSLNGYLNSTQKENFTLKCFNFDYSVIGDSDHPLTYGWFTRRINLKESSSYVVVFNNDFENLAKEYDYFCYQTYFRKNDVEINISNSTFFTNFKRLFPNIKLNNWEDVIDKYKKVILPFKWSGTFNRGETNEEDFTESWSCLSDVR